MVIIYLSSLSDLMAIIMKFAAMTFIVSVDNMYANALFENKMKEAAGKHLRIYYKSHMNHLDLQSQGELGPIINEQASEEEQEMLARSYMNPRRGSIFLQLLRLI